MRRYPPPPPRAARCPSPRGQPARSCQCARGGPCQASPGPHVRGSSGHQGALSRRSARGAGLEPPGTPAAPAARAKCPGHGHGRLGSGSSRRLTQRDASGLNVTSRRRLGSRAGGERSVAGAQVQGGGPTWHRFPSLSPHPCGGASAAVRTDEGSGKQLPPRRRAGGQEQQPLPPALPRPSTCALPPPPPTSPHTAGPPLCGDLGVWEGGGGPGWGGRAGSEADTIVPRPPPTLGGRGAGGPRRAPWPLSSLPRHPHKPWRLLLDPCQGLRRLPGG